MSSGIDGNKPLDLSQRVAGAEATGPTAGAQAVVKTPADLKARFLEEGAGRLASNEQRNALLLKFANVLPKDTSDYKEKVESRRIKQAATALFGVGIIWYVGDKLVQFCKEKKLLHDIRALMPETKAKDSQIEEEARIYENINTNRSRQAEGAKGLPELREKRDLFEAWNKKISSLHERVATSKEPLSPTLLVELRVLVKDLEKLSENLSSYDVNELNTAFNELSHPIFELGQQLKGLAFKMSRGSINAEEMMGFIKNKLEEASGLSSKYSNLIQSQIQDKEDYSNFQEGVIQRDQAQLDELRTQHEPKPGFEKYV